MKQKLRTKRARYLEYTWIFMQSFYVNAYTARHKNGKRYIVYAHDFNDMNNFLLSLDCYGEGLATRQKDCFDHFETRRILSYIPTKSGKIMKRPFWYRGRVYEILEDGE